MWLRNVAGSATPLASNEDDFIEGQDPDESAHAQPYTGYAAIFGAWHVVLLEAENPLMSKIIKHLDAKVDEPNSYYADIWVVHYTEDIAQRVYEGWVCKSYKEQSELIIKDDSDFEKIFKTYEGMVSVGKDA
jgi:hypothetical protein